jgi:TonB family protein
MLNLNQWEVQLYLNNILTKTLFIHLMLILKIEFTVRVDFTISKTGNPINIKVDKSPSEEFTKEAIRIIDSGPRWSPKIKDGIPVEGEIEC